MVTVAPGTTPLTSLTVPTIAPVVTCASSAVALQKHRTSDCCSQPRREIAKRTHGQPPGQGSTKRTLRGTCPECVSVRPAGQIVDNSENGAV